MPNTRPDLDYLRKPTREYYPDAGEYGRFELLSYSAFVWLAFAVILNLARVLGEFIGWTSISSDTARHALAVGFITLLIFGMAARMVPEFSHKKGLAYPQLVIATLLLGNLAALLRVVPTLFPDQEIALLLWGLSGVIGWAAIAVLAVDLIAAFLQPKMARQGNEQIGPSFTSSSHSPNPQFSHTPPPATIPAPDTAHPPP